MPLYKSLGKNKPWKVLDVKKEKERVDAQGKKDELARLAAIKNRQPPTPH